MKFTMNEISLIHHNLFSYSLVVAYLLFASCNPTKSIKYENGAISPAKGAGSFETEPGFKIELIASEPLITDPVDMEIDEFGRMYVVEMHGYPLDKSGSGKIKLITDSDGDGKLDKSTLFADRLVLPNGVMRWKKGILVTDAPYVLYFEDTDGDGIADIRDTILSGFSLSNPHINVNNPLYGLDNWIHLAHRGAITTRSYQKIFGDEGTEIYYPGFPNTARLPKNAENRSVRFKPDEHKLEMTAAQAQFGHAFDLWGHHLFGDNQNHAFAEVMAAPYIKRNPNLLIPGATAATSDHGNAAEIFQITTHPERQMFSGAGTMTSASGIVAYNDGAFPAPFDKNLTFICESVSNLVHADKLSDTGATFVASRVGTPQKEFIASRDAWSRPVNLYVGPDGALYIVDYYRRIIEHPEWMSDEAVKEGGFYDGSNMGRIYRVTAKDAVAAEWIKGLKVGDELAENLVKHLESPYQWYRTTAQRLLVDKQEKKTVPALIYLAKNSRVAAGRLHALWTLEGMHALTPALIEWALKDTVAGIRENAVKLAEIHLSDAPALENALFALQDDNDAKVRFQLLCTMGSIDNNPSEQIRKKLLFSDINEEWMQMAALSATSAQSGSLLATVLDNYNNGVPAYSSLTQRLASMVGASGDKSKIHTLIRQAIAPGTEQWKAPLLNGLAQGITGNNSNLAVFNDEVPLLVKTAFGHPSDEVRKAAFQLLKASGISNDVLAKETMIKAALNAANKNLSEEKRIESIEILSLRDPSAQSELLKKIIIPQEQPSLQMAAIRVLSLVPDNTVTNYILQVWPTLTPDVRDVALNTFMVNEARKKQLLRAIKLCTVLPASLGWNRSAQLMQDNDDAIRNQARALFSNKEEAKVNAAFKKALDLKGDYDSGKIVFVNNCALCHQVRGTIGIAFGPDLGTVQGWLEKDIMANILAPNLSIATGFDLWEVALKDGEIMQGIIGSETASAIKLKTAPGVEKILNRENIKSLKVLNRSIMPTLSTQISHQQMADLLAFLKQKK
ncbi:MAG: PVC-type heme-binding CxxCH protein [Sphingobacteriaceae bacterium]